MLLCLILQELMRKMVKMGIKVERRENRNFWGLKTAFSGACLIVKTLNWPIQYLYQNKALRLYFLFM
jgi:hypothetical protein